MTKEYLDSINPGNKLMEILANFGKGGFGNITIHGDLRGFRGKIGVLTLDGRIIIGDLT